MVIGEGIGPIRPLVDPFLMMLICSERSGPDGGICDPLAMRIVSRRSHITTVFSRPGISQCSRPT
jgi:hypothetical protein